MCYSETMKHTFDQAAQAVAQGQMTIGDAAEACGLTRSTFYNRLRVRPDYVKAQAEGRISSPVNAPVDDSVLKQNPAVQAVASGQMSLRQACTQYPEHAPNPVTLSRWVKRAFPDNEIGDPSRKKRVSTEEMVAKDLELFALGIENRAKELNIDPVKVGRWVLKRLEASKMPETVTD